MNQYRETQGQISQYQVQAPQGSAQEMGFQILQECRVEARALLNKAYRLELLHPPSSPMEESKRQLQRFATLPFPSILIPLTCTSSSVIIDASARRFQAQKFYLRATAAMRWIHSRNALIQQSQKSQSSSAAKPKPLDAILNGVRTYLYELPLITVGR